MDSFFARISDRYMLRGWSDCPLALVERQYGEQLLRCDGYEYVIRSCDGTCDFSSPAFLPAHRAQLNGLIEAGFAVRCRQGEGLLESQKYIFMPYPVLKELNWAVTDSCNLHCLHCFMNSPDKKESVRRCDIEQILQQIISAKLPFITLTGGEPLLSPHFRLIVSELSKAGIRITHISTNGVLLNDSILDFLLDSGQHPDLLISFDGTGAHDSIRGQQGLEKLVLKNTELALQKGFSAVIVTTLMQQNIHVLMPTYTLLKTVSPSGWFIHRAQSSGLYKNEKRLTIQQTAGAILPLRRRWLSDGKPFPLVPENFNPPQRPHIYTESSPECFGNNCGAFLLPDGTLMPCQGFVGTEIQKHMPNVLSMGLIEAWKSPSIDAFRHAVKADRLKLNPECAACPHFRECGMGCRAYALTEAGNINAPDPDFCELYKQGWRKAFDEQN